MVNHEENINRMHTEGLISEHQATLLKSAVQTAEIMPQTQPRHPLKFLLPTLITIGFTLLAIMISSSGTEPETIQNVSEILNQPGSTGYMNRQLNAVLGIAILLIIPLVMVMWLYNSIVDKEEKTMESWAQVESAYQRRADLIPALIETVSKYIKHEKSVLENVTELRAGSTANADGQISNLIQAQKTASDVMKTHLGKVPTDETSLADLAKAQAIVAKSTHQLLAIAESYPQLKSQENFIALQDQLEGSENRINTVRMIFNEAAGEYNAAIRKLPGSLIAAIGNFKRKAYFKADEASHQKFTVNFDE